MTRAGLRNNEFIFLGLMILPRCHAYPATNTRIVCTVPKCHDDFVLTRIYTSVISPPPPIPCRLINPSFNSMTHRCLHLVSLVHLVFYLKMFYVLYCSLEDVHSPMTCTIIIMTMSSPIISFVGIIPVLHHIICSTPNHAGLLSLISTHHLHKNFFVILYTMARHSYIHGRQSRRE